MDSHNTCDLHFGVLAGYLARASRMYGMLVVKKKFHIFLYNLKVRTEIH